MNFYAIDHLVLADANMLNKLSPFFAILFSFFILREKLRAPQILGVLTAFSGALLIIRPTGSNLTLFPAACGALGGLGAGLAYTFVRKMGQNGENGTRIVFWFSLFSCVVTLPYFVTAGVPMTHQQFLILLCAGLCGAGGQFSITKAYYYAPARELSVYEYVQVLFAAVWGRLLFHQTPDLLSFAGYAVIIGTAVVMFLYNNHFGPFHPVQCEKT
jgi:drug/metabolite transporter (DMT)-like permease